MENILIELINQYGIINYTFGVGLFILILITIYDLIANLTGYLMEKAFYYRDKKENLKNNGS